MRRKPFGVGEWYHCYSRGVDKRRTFQSVADYQRFQQLMYLCNSENPVHLSALKGRNHQDMFLVKSEKKLVSIAAYTLMPNHFHFLLKETSPSGITKFMQKLGTAYTMYFNIKNERVGGLFVKPFRSKHIEDDRYLKHVIQYIHLNQAEVLNKNWETGKVQNLTKLEKQLSTFPFSSLYDYFKRIRPEAAILSRDEVETFSDEIAFSKILSDAAKYNELVGNDFKTTP